MAKGESNLAFNCFPGNTLSFLRLQASIAFWIFLLSPFLLRDSCPQVVDIMVI